MNFNFTTGYYYNCAGLARRSPSPYLPDSTQRIVSTVSIEIQRPRIL
jgi:hypothetical protein